MSATMTHSPLDKITELDSIEKEIIVCIQNAGGYQHYLPNI